MFGGITFMVQGNFCCGVSGDDLVARVGAEAYEASLAEPHVREMDFTGRSMRGWIYVAPAGLAAEQALEDWVGRSRRFVRSLPPKVRQAGRARQAGKARKAPKARS